MWLWLARQLFKSGSQCALAVDRRRDAGPFHKITQKASGLLRTQIIAQIFGLATMGIGDAGGKSLKLFRIFALRSCVELGERKA